MEIEMDNHSGSMNPKFILIVLSLILAISACFIVTNTHAFERHGGAVFVAAN